MTQNTNVNSMLKVLDYTKTNKKWFDEKELYAGYHTVTIEGETYKGQRDPEKRLAKVDYDFTGKRVLDIGCSNGGLLHALSEKVAFGVGVDFNAKCINAANALKAINRRDNIHFYTFDLDKEDISMLKHFVFGDPVDIAFFFNISLWVKRWKEVFVLAAELSQSMLFEAHGNEKQQQEQLKFVKSVYKEVQLLSEQSDDDPTYAKRKMYICQEKITRGEVNELPEDVQYLKVYSEEEVKQAYEASFSGEKADSIKFFPNTQESVVAEINGDYIVKLPRPSRGTQGLAVEQAVTDFIRDKVQLSIPNLDVRSEPVVLARYPKLLGNTFDKKAYAKLSVKDQDGLAKQLAQFFVSVHSISQQEVKAANIPMDPSWAFKLDLIEEQFGNDSDIVIKALVDDVLKNHKALKVADENLVFGHFDIHGGNILCSKDQKTITGVIDFGNCKIGDVHQDLSTLNLSSPDLAQRVAIAYENLSGRKLNRILVQHYTTIFYLNLLAGLKAKNAGDKYTYWLGELKKWYDFLLDDRATARLNKHKPVTAISPGWRKWLASNVMKGASTEGLQKILREQGFSHIDIATEIRLVKEHPYVQAGSEIFHTLNKRNWLMKTQNTLASLDSRYAKEVEVREAPSFETFTREYYSKHLPVMLTKGVDNWAALSKWNPEFLLENFGDQEIEVQLGRDDDPLFERNASKHKKRINMRTFVEMIQTGGDSNNYYMTANNTKNSLGGINGLFDDLGDFAKGYRDMSGENSTGTFFWFGPKGTFTPLHHDLTNNMLVQIYGRKKVTLIPADQVQWLYNDKGVFSATDFPNTDEKRHSLMKNVTPIEIVIKPGDALFVPVGWWHTVESLDVSISVSFTNFNLPNQFASEFPKK